MDSFDVYVLRFEVNEERATRGLMQVFGLSEAAARIFVHSVPRVGKRNVPTDAAERYVRALHAVGAIVECRRTGTAPLGDSANRIQAMSLPAPATSQYPGASHPPTIMQDSLGVMGPLQYSPDMPQIPKAPRIPADLHAIRSRKGPDSLAPNWRNSRQTQESRAPSESASWRGRSARADSTPQPMNSLNEAGFWSPDAGPQISSDPLGQINSPFERANESPSPERETEALDRIDQRALDGDLSSPTPFSPSPFMPSNPNSSAPAPWFMNASYQLLLACLIIGGMILAMSSGVFETDSGRHARAFQQAGIDPGEFEPAATYVGRAGNEFDGLPEDKLHGLLDGLVRAGSPNIWIGDITRRGGERASHTLLVELPKDPTARRTIFDRHVKPAPLREVPPPDTGQRYLRLAF
ncbi:MAG TPA: hypothetical protein VHZ95_11520 [Polyangiales bacterium]|nr:hypothetical protein [Polyangiales bacterium]